MALLLGILGPIQYVNQRLLSLGKWLAIAALGFMVVFIMVQIFFRYVLNNALPWPEEASRFLMLWMTGLIVPMAYRRGGFVAIDMMVEKLPVKMGEVIALLLLILSLFVLSIAVFIGYGEITGFAGTFKTASLYYPNSFDLSSWGRIPKSWMMASLLVGYGVMILVNVELILRSVISLFGGQDDLPPLETKIVEME